MGAFAAESFESHTTAKLSRAGTCTWHICLYLPWKRDSPHGRSPHGLLKAVDVTCQLYKYSWLSHAKFFLLPFLRVKSRTRRAHSHSCYQNVLNASFNMSCMAAFRDSCSHVFEGIRKKISAICNTGKLAWSFVISVLILVCSCIPCSFIDEPNHFSVACGFAHTCLWAGDINESTLFAWIHVYLVGYAHVFMHSCT